MPMRMTQTIRPWTILGITAIAAFATTQWSEARGGNEDAVRLAHSLSSPERAGKERETLLELLSQKTVITLRYEKDAAIVSESDLTNHINYARAFKHCYGPFTFTKNMATYPMVVLDFQRQSLGYSASGSLEEWREEIIEPLNSGFRLVKATVVSPAAPGVGPFARFFFAPIILGGCGGGVVAWVHNILAVLMVLLLLGFALTVADRLPLSNRYVFAALCILVCLVLNLLGESARTFRYMIEGGQSCCSLGALVHRSACDAFRIASLAGLLLLPTLLVHVLRSSKGASRWTGVALLVLVALFATGFTRVCWTLYRAMNPPTYQVFTQK